MPSTREERTLALLEREAGWVSAARIGDALGVSARSVRTYVHALNERAAALGLAPPVDSGPRGYRADPEAAALVRERASAERDDSPAARRARVARLLLDADSDAAADATLSIEATAAALHVSTATLEGDLSRLRRTLDGHGLTLERAGETVRLRGGERAERRLLRALVVDDVEAAPFDLVLLRSALAPTPFDASGLADFRADLVPALAARGIRPTEYGIRDLLVDVAIAATRVARGRVLDTDVDGDAPAGDGEGTDAAAALIADLVRARLSVTLPAPEARALAALVEPAAPADAGAAVRAVVAAAVADAAAEFSLPLGDDAFVDRLAAHVERVRGSADRGEQARNPLTRSMKTSYPVLFDVAVFLGARLREAFGLDLGDDGLAYLAMHVGGEVERSRVGVASVTAAIIAPDYHELHELLRTRVEHVLADAVRVVASDASATPAWERIDADLVLSTIAPPRALGRTVVRVQPFLTDDDIERVRQAASRVRRTHRRARLRGALGRYLPPGAFVRGFPPGADEEGVIRALGGLLVDAGVIDEEHVDRAVQRERLSSTAFADALAVPHALERTAARTAIAVAVSEHAMAWGEARVHLVAFVAFGENDRSAFQTVFEQLVDVLSEAENVRRVARVGTDHAAFLDELAAVIDS